MFTDIVGVMGQHYPPLDWAIALLLLAGLVFIVVPLCIIVFGMIFRRAGYSFALAALMVVPAVNIVWLLIFAFSRWPVQKELDAYENPPRAVGAPPPHR